MAIFGNNKNPAAQQEQKRRASERIQKSGNDKRVYGDLLYRCRRCGYEGKIPDVPNCDKVAYALMNGNQSHIFYTTNFYFDEDTHTTYKECMHHECEPGKYGYMELIGADIKGQIYLADKYKKYSEEPTRNYGGDDEIPMDDLLT